MALPNESHGRGGFGLGLDLGDIMRSARRFRFYGGALVVLFTLAAGLGTLRMPKVYQARAKLLMEPVLPKILADDPSIQELSEQLKRERKFFNTQYEIITSRPVMLRAAERIGPSLSGSGSDDSDRAVHQRLASMVQVSPDRATQIVDLVAEAQNPERAALIANAVAQAYIDYTLERRVESARSASRWLDERVSELETKLALKEKELADFRQENLLVSVDLEDRRNMTSASLALLNERLLEVKTKLIEKKAFQRSLSETSSGAMQSLEFDDSPHAQVLKDLRATLVDLERRRAELSTRYGEKHPKMVAIVRQLEELRRTSDRERKLHAESVQKTIEALEENLIQLQSEIDIQKQKALQLNSLTLGYTALTRDFGTTREIYESLLRKQTETGLSLLLDSNFVQWYQRAEPSSVPVRPSMIQNALLGLATGTLLSVLCILVLSILDHSVHSRGDIEQSLGLPFLGVYPRMPAPAGSDAKDSGSLDLFVFHNPQTTAAECARSIRTNLLFMNTARPAKCILVTSPRPGEGKTTTTVALGVAMAQAGNRVLLVDADLRRPQLHRSFGNNRREGLTNMLIDPNTRDLIQSTEVRGLDLLPSGPTPPNPAELLQSDRFAELLRDFNDRYDRVLVDSPPVGMVVDASILSKVTDGTVVVTQADQTPKDALRRAVSRLQDVQAHIIGVILNYVEAKSNRYEYEGYYAMTETDEPELAPLK